MLRLEENLLFKDHLKNLDDMKDSFQYLKEKKQALNKLLAYGAR